MGRSATHWVCEIRKKEQVRYSFCPTTGERYRVMTLICRRSWLRQGMFWLMVVVLPLTVIGLVGLTLAKDTHTVADGAARPCLGVGVLLGWGIALVGPRVRCFNCRQRNDNPVLRGPWEYGFGPKGL